jgi:hypothetical protein
MNDQRLAEWLADDDAAPAPDEDAGAPGRPADGVPTAVVARRRRPAVLGLDGREARLLELVHAIGRRIRRRPLAALAVGVAAGFVIGGALSFRAGRILLAAGTRHVARELLKQLL